MSSNENNDNNLNEENENENENNNQNEENNQVVSSSTLLESYFYEVCFKACSNVYSHDNSNITERSLVIVQADRGYDIGVIYRNVSLENGTLPTGKTIRKILSVITNEDKYIKYMLRSKVLSETHALTMSRSICSELKVGPSVDIITVEFQADRKKLTVYYKKHADVSLCKLIRKLHSAFKMRIWMENIDVVIKEDQNIPETFKKFADRYFELVDIDPEVVNEEQANADNNSNNNNNNNNNSNNNNANNNNENENQDTTLDTMVANRSPAFLQHTPQLNINSNNNINNINNNNNNQNKLQVQNQGQLHFQESYPSNSYYQLQNVPSGNLTFLNRPGFNNLNSNTISREVNYDTQLNETQDNGYNNNNNNNEDNTGNIRVVSLQRNNNNNNNNNNSNNNHNNQIQYGIKPSQNQTNRSEFLSYPDSNQMIGNLSQVQKNIPNTQRRNVLPSRQPIPNGYSDYLPHPPPSSLSSPMELYQTGNRRATPNSFSQRLLTQQQQQQQYQQQPQPHHRHQQQQQQHQQQQHSRYTVPYKSSPRDIYDGYSHNYQHPQEYDEYTSNQSVYEDYPNTTTTPQIKYRVNEMEKYRYMNNRMEPLSSSSYNTPENQQQQQQQSSSNTFSLGLSNSNSAFPYEISSYSNYNNSQQFKSQGGNNNPPSNRNVESFGGISSINSYLSPPSSTSNTSSTSTIPTAMNNSYKNTVPSIQNYSDQSSSLLHHNNSHLSSSLTSLSPTDKPLNLNSTTMKLSSRPLHSYQYSGISSNSTPSPTFSEYSSYEWNSSDPANTTITEGSQLNNSNNTINTTNTTNNTMNNNMNSTNPLEVYGNTSPIEYEARNIMPLSMGNSSFQHHYQQQQQQQQQQQSKNNTFSSRNHMASNSLSYNNSYENELNSSSFMSMSLLGSNNNQNHIHNNNNNNSNNNNNNNNCGNIHTNVDNLYIPEGESIDIYIQDQDKYIESHYQPSLKSSVILSNQQQQQQHNNNNNNNNQHHAILSASSANLNSNNLPKTYVPSQQQYSIQNMQTQLPISSDKYYYSSQDRSGNIININNNNKSNNNIGISGGIKGIEVMHDDNLASYYTNFDTK